MGYQSLSFAKPVLQTARPAMPVVNIALVRPVVIAEPSAEPPGLSDKKKAEACERRRVGESVRAIAAALGTTRWAIKQATAEVPAPEGGWPRSKKRPHPKLEFARRLRRAEFTYAEIGAEIGLSESGAHLLLCGRSRVQGKRARIADLVYTVRRSIGVPCSELRKQAEEGGVGKRAEDRAKGRHILFWLAKRSGLGLSVIGRSLGGFNHTSVLHGIRRVDAVIASQNVCLEGPPGRIARRLWQADWSAA